MQQCNEDIGCTWSVGQGLDNPLHGPLFFQYFLQLKVRNQGKTTMDKPFQARFLPGYTFAIITAHAPGPLGLSFSDCFNWISRPDKIYQNSWPQTFDYCIGHRVGLKIFPFTQFCSMLIEQLINLRKEETENLNLGQNFEIMLWMVCQYCSVTQQMIILSSKLLK